MSDAFQKKVEEAIRNPKNLGKMEDADSVGTVGGAGCGDMLRMWLKFRDQDGKQVIDKASFQSFGCETAIAAASLATELIRGKTTEEAMSMSGAVWQPTWALYPQPKYIAPPWWKTRFARQLNRTRENPVPHLNPKWKPQALPTACLTI